jgi:hypothetical protein
MPSLADYRHSLAVESGPFVGPDSYDVRATSGSDITKVVCSNYPIRSSIGQNDLYGDLPLYRPNAVELQDKYRYVLSYDPPTGTLTPDLPWAFPPYQSGTGNSYGFLEAYTYHDLEGMPPGFLYEDLEGFGQNGLGERFEILGPWDVPTMHRLINDGLKQCWMVVDVVCMAQVNVTRHDLAQVCPWLQDANHVRQVGVLPQGIDPWVQDPFENLVYGSIERDGGRFLFNSGTRTFNAGDQLWLRCYKRAYDHCRQSGGTYGDQAGLVNETDEAPIERDWATSSALLVGWRRYGHLLEPAANQRLIRDQAAAAAWFNDRTHQHFTAVQPQMLFRRARMFGPAQIVG